MARTREPGQAPAAAPTPARRGLYAVRLADCPRRDIDTGMPAGPAAEAVARDRYLTWLQLQPKAGRVPEVKLLEV